MADGARSAESPHSGNYSSAESSPRAERAFIFILRVVRFLLTPRKAAEPLVLGELLEIFLAGRETSYLLVLLGLLGVSLALGKSSSSLP